MAAAQKSTAHPGNVNEYQQQLQAVNRLRNGYKDLAGNTVPGLNLMMQASGQYGVETLRAVSATERFTKSIIDQKLGLGSVVGNYKQFRQQLRMATQEQVALRKASAMQWTSGLTGKSNVDLYVPKNLGKDLNDMRTKYGMLNSAVHSIGTSTLNWGKNTQWAGRQITAGLSMPIILAAAGLAALANSADKQLTRITKVYDTTASQMANGAQNQAAVNAELDQLRANSLRNSTQLAQEYGASVNETLGLEADLAAVGLKGNELLATTAQVTRIATLGELDHQTALDTTISLMSAFKLKGDELNDTFNYMNAIENATSLSTQDFATAIPIAANSLASMGVTVQQFGILMTAFKEGGVDAAQGANALKSATVRLLNPTAAATAAFQAMGINIAQVVNSTEGNLFATLSELGEKMKGFDSLTKNRALADLFGTYQFNKLNVALTGITDGLAGVGSGFSQTAKAIEVAGDGAASWATTADNEIDQFQQSASGKFKIAVESMKAELINLGGPILEALTPVVTFIGNLVAGFNNMPGVIKKFIAGFLVVAAIAGPIIMLTGLIANLLGKSIQATTSFANLFLRFKALTPQQRADEAIAKLATQTYNSEAQAIGLLAQKMTSLTTAIEQQVAARAKLNAPLLPTNINSTIATPAAATARANVAPTAATYAGMQGASQVIASGKYGSTQFESIARNAAKTKVSMVGAATAVGSFALAAYSMQQIASGSGNMMMNVMMAATALPGLISGVKSLTNAIKEMSLANSIAAASGGVSTLSGKIGTLTTGAMTGLRSMAGLLFSPTGLLVGGVLLAVGALAYLTAHMNDAQKRQEALNRSTASWRELLNYTPNAELDPNVQTNSPLSAYEARQKAVNDLAKANEDLVQALKDAREETNKNDDALYNLAEMEAVKVKLDGGSAENARDAFNIALQAAGLNQVEINELDVRFDHTNWDNKQEAIDEVLRQIQEAFTNEGPIDIDLDLGDSALAAGSDAGAMLYTGMKATMGQDRMDLWTGFADSANNKFKGEFNKIQESHAELFQQLGITDAAELQQAIVDAQNAQESGTTTSAQNTLLSDMATESGGELQRFTDTYKQQLGAFLDGIGQAMDKSDEEIQAWKDEIFTMGDLGDVVAAPTMTVAAATESWGRTLYQNSMSAHKMSEEALLLALNTLRAKAGLAETTNVADGMNTAITAAGNAAGEASTQFADMAAALNTVGAMDTLNGQQQADLMKSSFSGAVDASLEYADRMATREMQHRQQANERASKQRQDAYEQQAKDLQNAQDVESKILDKAQDAQSKALGKAQDAESDALKDAQQAREDAIDAQIQGLKDLTDARTQAIQDQIDAEDEQDKLRQKLFDAEKSRIERLAQLFSNNVDFNAALNSGNMDEAAKIFSSNQATVAGWSADDQKAKLDEESDARKKVLEDSIKTIEDERDARIDALQAQKDALKDLADYENDLLKDRQEAESEALKDTQDREKEELQAKQQAAQDAITAAKEAEATRTANANRAEQERLEDRKAALDQEIAAVRASVPRTKAEYEAQMAQIRQLYQNYGVDLTATAGGWTQVIGDNLEYSVGVAAASLQNEIGWQQIGSYIQQQIDAGSQLTLAQITEYLKTGIWPAAAQTGASAPWAAAGKKPVFNTSESGAGKMVRHTGGVIDAGPNRFSGISAIDRTGVPANAPLYPSEYMTILKRGEYVVNEKQTSKNLGLLEAINTGKAPNVRHTGGLAGGPSMTSGLAYAALEMAAAKHAVANESKKQQIIAQRKGQDGVYTGGMSKGINDTLNFGRSQMGKPYIWGGAGPAGQDCSGFMSVLYNFMTGVSPGNNQFPWGRDWVTASFSGGKEFGPWRRGGDSSHAFRIGVDPGSHMAGTLGGINVESGSGHGPRVGGNALGANDRSFPYQFFLPAADIPQLYKGGTVRYDNTLANLHAGETVLTAPLTQSFKDNVASGSGSAYNVTVDLRGSYIKEDIDIEKAINRAIDERENKLGRKRTVN